MCSLLHILGFSAQSQTCNAWISIDAEDSGLQIEAHCQSLEAGYVDFELKSVKTGMAGSAQSTQKGRVYLEQGKEECISRLRLGVSPKDNYEIQLEIFKEGKLICKDSVVSSGL
jgi:hypothetical protein